MRYRYLLAALACACLPLKAAAQTAAPVSRDVKSITIEAKPQAKESERAKALRISKEKRAKATPMTPHVPVSVSKQKPLEVETNLAEPILLEQPATASRKKEDSK